MDKFREALKKIFTQFNNNLGLYTTVFVTATYHLIAEKDFACSCKPQNQQKGACRLHLFLPMLLLWFLLLLLDKSFHRAVGNISTCGKKEESKALIQNDGPPNSKRACCLAMVSVFRALSISSIWMAAVFLDGDWWLCCQNNGSDEQAQVACKPPPAYTMEEMAIAADLKSFSMNIGFVVLLIATTIVALTKACACCKYENHDDELAERIFEEGLGVVLEIQHKEAVDKLKERVKTRAKQNKWMKCSDAVKELMNEIQQSKTS